MKHEYSFVDNIYTGSWKLWYKVNRRLRNETRLKNKAKFLLLLLQTFVHQQHPRSQKPASFEMFLRTEHMSEVFVYWEAENLTLMEPEHYNAPTRKLWFLSNNLNSVFSL